VTLTGTPAFASQFVYCVKGRVQSTLVWSGSATGQRYSVSRQGHIEVFGAGTSHFPGNSAGSTDSASYGLYT